MDDDEILMYDDELDAAKAAVQRLGGAKKVGEMLYPEKTPEAAARYLLDALNPSRSERLNPGQVLLLMRKAREIGFHGLAAFYMRGAGYAPPVPLDPVTETARMAHALERVMGTALQIAAQLRQMNGGTD